MNTGTCDRGSDLLSGAREGHITKGACVMGSLLTGFLSIGFRESSSQF